MFHLFLELFLALENWLSCRPKHVLKGFWRSERRPKTEVPWPVAVCSLSRPNGPRSEVRNGRSLPGDPKVCLGAARANAASDLPGWRGGLEHKYHRFKVGAGEHAGSPMLRAERNRIFAISALTWGPWGASLLAVVEAVSLGCPFPASGGLHSGALLPCRGRATLRGDGGDHRRQR